VGAPVFTQLPIPLSERVEFLSDAYLDTIATFVEEQKGSWPDFSVSRRCANPPAHISQEPRGYTLSFSDSQVSLTRFPSNDASVSQDLDYNAALWLGSIVRAENEASAHRRDREYRHLFGVKPRASDIPVPVQRTLDALGDHMARRTVDNPDIAHKIDSFGLQQCIEDFEDTGFTVFRNAFTDEFAEAMREEAALNHAGRPEGSSFRATMLLKRGSLWEEALVHPWILTVAEYLVGRGCLLYQTDTIVKSPGQETHPGLHSDYAASRITEPFPEFCVLTVAVWAIDDFLSEHGPTVIKPGSFRERRQVPPGTTQEGTIRIEMPQGSIAMWNGATWHGSTPRTAPGKRTSLHNTYCRNYIRPLEQYQDIDASILARNPPMLSSLCGLDDAFGKSGYEGADFERMGYAARSGFAQSGPLPHWSS